MTDATKAAPWGSEWLFYGRRHGQSRLWTGTGEPHNVYGHPLSRFGFAGIDPPLGYGTFNAALTRLSFLGCCALAFWEKIVDGPGGKGGYIGIVFAPGLDLTPAQILAGAREHLSVFAEKWPEIDVSLAELGVKPKVPTIPNRAAAIAPEAFMKAAYELAGRRPPRSVGPNREEPAWNVDLFEVERRAREIMAVELEEQTEPFPQKVGPALTVSP